MIYIYISFTLHDPGDTRKQGHPSPSPQPPFPLPLPPPPQQQKYIPVPLLLFIDKMGLGYTYWQLDSMTYMQLSTLVLFYKGCITYAKLSSILEDQ